MTCCSFYFSYFLNPEKLIMSQNKSFNRGIHEERNKHKRSHCNIFSHNWKSNVKRVTHIREWILVPKLTKTKWEVVRKLQEYLSSTVWVLQVRTTSSILYFSGLQSISNVWYFHTVYYMMKQDPQLMVTPFLAKVLKLFIME